VHVPKTCRYLKLHPPRIVVMVPDPGSPPVPDGMKAYFPLNNENATNTNYRIYNFAPPSTSTLPFSRSQSAMVNTT
jgi:hypothetical protein